MSTPKGREAGHRVTRRHLTVLAVAIAFVGALALPSRACQLCTPYPRASAADYLLSAEAVVFAREDPDRPFHYAIVEVLKGDPGDESIDLFLDSRTRRVLAVHPERAAVLALMRLECGALAWRRVGMADEDFGPTVRHILASHGAWLTNATSRHDYFAQWLGHPNSQLRDLAHIEVARAPYKSILRYRSVLSREEIDRFLGNVRKVDWHPLYILFLSATDHPDDHERIRRSFHSCARLGTTRTLQSWTAAYIEIAGVEAIEEIEALYFRRGDRGPDEVAAVLNALSVHGSGGHVHLRDRIVESYAVMLERYPEHAVDLLRDLQAWNRTDLSPAISAIITERSDMVEVAALRQLQGHLLHQMRTSLRPARAPRLR
ncbi:MAG: hypothetical protein AAF726_09995 [Planctomycetota bacterium]